MKKLLAAAFLLFFVGKAVGQKDVDIDRASIIEQRIEQIAEAAEDENLDYNTLFEQLSIYIDFPLNLNKASAEDLYSLGLLSNYQIGQLLEYRDKYGDLFSIYELPLISGWNQFTSSLIEPFVTVIPDAERDRISLKKMLNYGKNEYVVRWQRILEDQQGYAPINPEELEDSPNSRYLGSPDKVYMRYRYRYDDRISFGLTAEKDNGEEFFQGSQPNGFDFYSAHLYLKNFGRVKQLALGDFQAQFGQGLTFWSGLGFNRKSSFTVSTATAGGGLGPYASINENLFLRGGGITVNQGNFDLTAFYSGKRIDGNIAQDFADSLEVEPEILVSSFQETGFHRTPAEVADKNAIFQEHFGGNLSFNRKGLHLGLTMVHMQLEGTIDPNLQPYSQFRFSGSENSAAGIDYAWKFRNFFVFGETTQSANGGLATLNGLNITMNPRLSVNITQRYYQKDFQQVASVAFGEGSTVENESGIYLGVEFRPFKKWRLNAFIDQFKFPWLRYQIDAPSAGYDFFAQLEYQPSSRFSMYLRYRDRQRQINTREEIDDIDFLVDNPRRNFRLNFAYRAGGNLKFRSRVELTEYTRGSEPTSRGFMLYQDVIYDFEKLPLRITCRYALFDTDSYDSRIYAYENDVLYFFSIPAYSGRGTRAYAMLKYDLGRNVNIWLRWAQFYYTDRNEVGSGAELINGNTKTEVKAQVQFKF